MTKFTPKLPNLIWLAAASLAGYLLFWWWFPLRPYFNTVPLQDVRSFALSLWAGLGYGLLLLALFGLYWLAFRAVQSEQSKPSLLFLLGTAVLFAIPLLQTYPINANDLYRYVIRGRVSSVYQQSPYATPPNAFPDDPFLPLAGEWADATSPYGPLWELLAAGTAAVTQNNLWAGLLAFKLVGLLAHLACGWLIWQLLAQTDAAKQRGFALLWLWNPALLLMFVVDGHNDVLMMVWQLVAIWFWRQERPLFTFFFLLLGALTKPIGLLPIPFFAVAIWRELENNTARLRVLGWGVLLGGTAVFLSFLPFGSPLDLLTRLVQESSGGPGFSPGTLLLLILGELGQPLTPEFIESVANWLRIPFGLLGLWLLWSGWRYGRSPLKAAADFLAAYTLQALSFRLWYSTWPFLWLLLEDEQAEAHVLFRLQAGLWFLLNVQLSVLIYGHLRVYLLGGSQLAAHLIGIPFVFLLPILLAYFNTRNSKQNLI
ncbi:polyprenol phosphomannose-dependent alpha 1,6 mannosyltransferase MptB [Candidatus Leptofilum sp.]|uniref:polyprenol phosphomannose-dependent alpha 1,6 mannosyltransferase MptB n=1 Tax=Candidatus Leptofilum sp. TaxID=3241576 RepID=UPI003B5B9A33